MKIFYVVCLLFLVLVVRGQETSIDTLDVITISGQKFKDSLHPDYPKYDLRFGKVTKVDFEVASPDSTASAIYLINDELVAFLTNVKYEQNRVITARMRIENEAGLEYAQQLVNLFIGDYESKEKLFGLKGATYNLENDKIIKTPLDPSLMKLNNINDYFQTASFTMPNARVGSVIEFTYTVGSNSLYVEDIDIQFDVPILYSKVRLTLSGLGTYGLMHNPRAPYSVKFKISRDDNIVNSVELNTLNSVPAGTTVDQLIVKNGKLGFISFNIPALSQENYIENRESYRSRLIITFLGEATDISLNANILRWKTVSEFVYSSPRFRKAIRKSKYYEDDLENAVSNANNRRDKIAAVLQLVKSTVKWNGEYGIYPSEDIEESYSLGSGNVADVNLLLLSMLKELGIEASPVLIATPDMNLPVFPDLEAFNYLIVQVNIGENQVLIDATETFAGINILPSRASYWKGLKIEGNGNHEWVDLNPYKSSEKLQIVNALMDGDAVITGMATHRDTNQQALFFRNKRSYVTNTQLSYLLYDDVNLIIDSLEYDSFDPLKPNVEYNYRFTLINNVNLSNDKLSFNPLLFLSNRENIVASIGRKLPLELQDMGLQKHVINMKIPDGYRLEKAPVNVKYIFANGVSEYSYITKLGGNLLSTVITYELNTDVILTQDYTAFRDYYLQILKKESENIVLIQKE